MNLQATSIASPGAVSPERKILPCAAVECMKFAEKNGYCAVHQQYFENTKGPKSNEFVAPSNQPFYLPPAVKIPGVSTRAKIVLPPIQMSGIAMKARARKIPTSGMPKAACMSKIIQVLSTQTAIPRHTMSSQRGPSSPVLQANEQCDQQSTGRTSQAPRRRVCKYEGCGKCARLGGFCISHGGGRRCLVIGCEKSAQSGGKCYSHGGGRRCQEDGCMHAVKSNGYCVRHYKQMIAKTQT